MTNLKSALAAAFILAPLLATAAPSDLLLGSYNSAFRTPGFDNGLPEGNPASTFVGSRTLNGAKNVVTESNKVQSVTSVFVDQEHAQIHNYLSFSQPNPLSTFPPEVIQDRGALTAFAKFSGSGDALQQITLSMDFHGLFSGISTTDPQMLLNGAVSVSVSDDLTGNSFISQATAGLQFQHLFDSSVVTYDSSSTVGPGASFEVVSMDAGNLVGHLSVTAWVKPGQYLILSGGVAATAVASGPPQQGVIDAWNTATLALSAPSGYSFDTNGNATFLTAATAVPTIPAVPEPGQWELSLAGLAAVSMVYRVKGMRRDRQA